MTVVKFPYDACRRVQSRKPRKSKNGTPEERAAKAAAVATNAAIIPLGEIPEQKLIREDGGSLVNFLRYFRQYVVQEFERGRDIDQIFDDLEDTYRRADEANKRFQARRSRASETSDFPVNLPVPDLGQPVLNLATERDQ
jgi:hypothetical protein